MNANLASKLPAMDPLLSPMLMMHNSLPVRKGWKMTEWILTKMISDAADETSRSCGRRPLLKLALEKELARLHRADPDRPSADSRLSGTEAHAVLPTTESAGCDVKDSFAQSRRGFHIRWHLRKDTADAEAIFAKLLNLACEMSPIPYRNHE